MTATYFVDNSPTIRDRIISWLLSRLLGEKVLVRKQGKKFFIGGELEVHASGNIRLTSDQHIILTSGNTREDRPGYRHSIWLNPELDNLRRPIQKLTLVNDQGREWDWEIEFDESGRVIFPKGWRPSE